MAEEVLEEWAWRGGGNHIDQEGYSKEFVGGTATESRSRRGEPYGFFRRCVHALCWSLVGPVACAYGCGEDGVHRFGDCSHSEWRSEQCDSQLSCSIPYFF